SPSRKRICNVHGFNIRIRRNQVAEEIVSIFFQQGCEVSCTRLESYSLNKALRHWTGACGGFNSDSPTGPITCDQPISPLAAVRRVNRRAVKLDCSIWAEATVASGDSHRLLNALGEEMQITPFDARAESRGDQLRLTNAIPALMVHEDLHC